MLDRVLPDFVLERLDVVVDRVGGQLLDQLREDRHRPGVEVDLLEVGVEETIQGHDLPVRSLPCWVQDVAGVGELAARRVGDDPVELAPAGFAGRVRPGVDGLRAVHQLDVHLPDPNLLGRPRHRRLHTDGLSALLRLHRMLAELDLPEPMAGPACRGEGLLANHVGQDRAGFFSRTCLDVDALEEVAIGRERVDLALGGGAGYRERGEHFGRPILEADDLAHLAEAGEIGRREVEHGNAMAVDAGVDVDDEIAAQCLGLHGRHPILGLLLVELDAETLC